MGMNERMNERMNDTIAYFYTHPQGSCDEARTKGGCEVMLVRLLAE
jgi:hypothetical protein